MHIKPQFIIYLSTFVSLSAFANQNLHIQISNAQKQQLLAASQVKSVSSFVKLNVDQLEMTKTVGSPELPVKSMLVKGTPEQIQVHLKINQKLTLENTKPEPVQEQDCRCEVANKVKTFAYNEKAFHQEQPTYKLEYLGAFRGQPISRLDIMLGEYNAQKNETQIATDVNVNTNTDEFVLANTADYKDMLILAPSQLVAGVDEFVAWKRAQGYNVYVETVQSPQNTAAAIQALIKKYYNENGIDFAIIIGDENTIPMFKVSTSGSSQTPSDLKYYTMDGADDNVPDILASRIVASDVDQVKAQLAKSIEFEQQSFTQKSGLNRMMGVASNEGSGPSDNEYIQAIENKFVEVKSSEIVHLYQNDSTKSRPEFFNQTLNQGALWVTYLGHGSGQSWPSFNSAYSTSHIKNISNKDVVKPVIIDVACQNGRLIKNYLGTTFMQVGQSNNQNAFGAAAYYGGSVNISWHPPAVMARGIAFEQLTKHYSHLGEALLAGQLYLAAQWANKTQVVDNFEWYHLQGDPSMKLNF